MIAANALSVQCLVQLRNQHFYDILAAIILVSEMRMVSIVVN